MCKPFQYVALVVLMAMPAAVLAQSTAAGLAPQSDVSPQFASGGASADYRLGAGDMLGITVFRSPALASQVMVDTDGCIGFPELGRVKVADLTVGEITEVLAKALARRGIVINPVVNVTVTQVRAKRASVMGAVAHPGDIALDRDGITLSQVLALAGANFGTGDAVVTLISKQSGGEQREQFRLAELISGRADRPARNADVIVVQAAPLVYVSGEVGHPGAFPLEPNMTLEQAIIVAGGATLRGSIHRVRITRKASDGSAQDLNHPQLHTALEPDDIVVVKTRVF